MSSLDVDQEKTNRAGASVCGWNLLEDGEVLRYFEID